MVFIAHYQIFVSFERKVLYFRLFKISLIKILEFRNCYFWIANFTDFLYPSLQISKQNLPLEGVNSAGP